MVLHRDFHLQDDVHLLNESFLVTGLERVKAAQHLEQDETHTVPIN
jgi:hypothetical protein